MQAPIHSERTASPWSVCTTLLERLNAAGPGEIVPVILETLRDEIEAVGVRLMFADVEERLLIVWGSAGQGMGEHGHRAMIDGSIQGGVYITGRRRRADIGPHQTVLAPVVARSERVGVIEVAFREAPDDRQAEVVSTVGLVIGYVAIAADRWTDEIHVARRREDMTLAAELQWNLLPLGAFSTERISVAGALEPAYDIAGDCFDYSCGMTEFSAGIFDAMGHGVAAARLTDLAMAALRNARRSGSDLEAQARFIHRSVGAHSGDAEFVTGQLVTIDMDRPARSRIVNAGHPPPFLQRGSDQPARVEIEVDYPFGIALPSEPSEQPLPLRPGDRLTLFSDGVVEARPDEGDHFGELRLASELQAHREYPPRESARRIIAAVREHRAADLVDDATIMMIDIPKS